MRKVAAVSRNSVCDRSAEKRNLRCLVRTGDSNVYEMLFPAVVICAEQIDDGNIAVEVFWMENTTLVEAVTVCEALMDNIAKLLFGCAGWDADEVLEDIDLLGRVMGRDLAWLRRRITSKGKLECQK